MQLYGKVENREALDDTLLLEWWERLVVSGDLLTVFGPGMERLSAFLASMQPPTELLFETEDNRIWYAAWLDPAPMAGVYLGVWAAEGKRQTREMLAAVLLTLEYALKRWPVVLVVTSDPRIMRLHQHFGFEKLGVIPELAYGKGLQVSYMTRERYQAVAAKFQAAGEA